MPRLHFGGQVNRDDEPEGTTAESSQSKTDWRKAADRARDWELNQLAKRLEELASG